MYEKSACNCCVLETHAASRVSMLRAFWRQLLPRGRIEQVRSSGRPFTLNVHTSALAAVSETIATYSGAPAIIIFPASNTSESPVKPLGGLDGPTSDICLLSGFRTRSRWARRGGSGGAAVAPSAGSPTVLLPRQTSCLYAVWLYIANENPLLHSRLADHPGRLLPPSLPLQPASPAPPTPFIRLRGLAFTV
jgi:hypothetical protein